MFLFFSYFLIFYHFCETTTTTTQRREEGLQPPRKIPGRQCRLTRRRNEVLRQPVDRLPTAADQPYRDRPFSRWCYCCLWPVKRCEMFCVAHQFHVNFLRLYFPIVAHYTCCTQQSNDLLSLSLSLSFTAHEYKGVETWKGIEFHHVAGGGGP